MDGRWSLDEMYTSVDSEKFQRDLEQFKKYLVSLNEYAVKPKKHA